MSALPKFTMRELLDAGVHFGHKTMRWNPKMAPYIYGERHNIHIIDLQRTVPLLHRALEVARDIAANNGRVLFVSTKRQASKIVADSAKRCGQYYVNHRWLGGMLTNWGTVSQSIKTLRDMQANLEDEDFQVSKKERLQMERKIEKLEAALGGIKDMGGLPDLIFVIDTNREDIAIAEANKLGIPVIAIVDSNSDPDNITHIIPGNDDATRSIQLYCDLLSEAVLGGIQASLGSAPKAVAEPKAAAKTAKKDEKAKTVVEKKAPKAAKAKEEKAEAEKEAKPAAKKAPAKKEAAKSTKAKAEKPAELPKEEKAADTTDEEAPKKAASAS